ncbi:putative membrane protein [Microbacterium natoriense]|uniref:Membrane protein n=1 Tax=Microbacterium natoriense TaxID=284570 RepID=A0AAW8EU69_9MICO|nr:hypothetical protein [Microbacterium natoriense]MDQ0646960.1 putative membrane protein [Microbacterium natoriense]
MSTPIKFVLHVFIGVILGVAVLFLGLCAAVTFAFATAGPVLLPGVFKAWSTTENEMPAMNFEPNYVGVLLVIVVVATLYGYVAFQSGRRISASGLNVCP